MINLSQYPDDAILTTHEVAEWIGCSPETVLRLPVQRAAAPTNSATFLAKDVKALILNRGGVRKKARA